MNENATAIWYYTPKLSSETISAIHDIFVVEIMLDADTNLCCRMVDKNDGTSVFAWIHWKSICRWSLSIVDVSLFSFILKEIAMRFAVDIYLSVWYYDIRLYTSLRVLNIQPADYDKLITNYWRAMQMGNVFYPNYIII